MSFLFPLYLLGVGAVALPILLHLRRRPPRDRTDFSSLMFLEATPLQRKRKRRLENLVLLLLRCALVCFLALLFARPLFRGGAADESGQEGRVQVVLLDRSASMQREDLWAQAVERARSFLADTSAEDRVAVVAFDRGVSLLAGFDEWKQASVAGRRELVEQALGAVVPGWDRTDFGTALSFAVELIEEEVTAGGASEQENGDTGKRIILISDLQEGANFGGLESVGWPAGTSLVLETVEPLLPDNASVHLVASENVLTLAGEGEAGGDDPGQDDNDAKGPRARVINESVSAVEEFTVAWKGAPDSQVRARVAAGMQRTVRLPPPADGAPAPELVLKGDPNDFDNRVFLAPAAKRPLRVLYFGGAEAGENDTSKPFFYLKRAIQATHIHEPWVSSVIPADVNLKETADFIVIGDAPEETLLGSIREYLEAGGRGLFLLRSRNQERVLEALLGLENPSVSEAEMEDGYALLEGIDFDSPLLGAFADPRVRDFAKVHFWKYRRLQPGAEWPEDTKVLARFDTGDPAWLVAPLGGGELIICTSGWHPADSQLGLSTKFVPLLYSFFESGGGASSRSGQFAVGDPLPIRGGVKVRRPDGSEEITANSESYYAKTDLPGIYVALDGEKEERFAVNLAARESRTQPVSAERFEEAGLPVAKPGARAESEAAAGAADPAARRYLLDSEHEKRQQLWRQLLAAALIVVFVEMVLSGRKAQPSAAEAV